MVARCRTANPCAQRRTREMLRMRQPVRARPALNDLVTNAQEAIAGSSVLALFTFARTQQAMPRHHFRGVLAQRRLRVCNARVRLKLLFFMIRTRFTRGMLKATALQPLRRYALLLTLLPVFLAGPRATHAQSSTTAPSQPVQKTPAKPRPPVKTAPSSATTPSPRSKPKRRVK